MCASTLTAVPPGSFTQEAANAPRFVGKRVDDLQSPSDDLGVRGIDAAGSPTLIPKLGCGPCTSWAPMMTSAVLPCRSPNGIIEERPEGQLPD